MRNGLFVDLRKIPTEFMKHSLTNTTDPLPTNNTMQFEPPVYVIKCPNRPVGPTSNAN